MRYRRRYRRFGMPRRADWPGDLLSDDGRFISLQEAGHHDHRRAALALRIFITPRARHDGRRLVAIIMITFMPLIGAHQ